MEGINKVRKNKKKKGTKLENKNSIYNTIGN